MPATKHSALLQEGRAGPTHHLGIRVPSLSSLFLWEHPRAPAWCLGCAAAPGGREEGEGEYIKQNDCNNKKPSCRRCKNAIGLKAADRAESINMGSRLFIAQQGTEVEKKKQINGAGGHAELSPKGINLPRSHGRKDTVTIPRLMPPGWAVTTSARTRRPSARSCRVQRDWRDGAIGVPSGRG